MPLPSSVHQDGAIEERDHHIAHENGKWVLRSKSTNKVLGTHDTKEDAEAQERAIQVNKHTEEHFGGPGSGRRPGGGKGRGIEHGDRVRAGNVKVGDKVRSDTRHFPGIVKSIEKAPNGDPQITVAHGGLNMDPNQTSNVHYRDNGGGFPGLTHDTGGKTLSLKVTVADMREICSPCADKMEKDGVKHFYLDMSKGDMGLPITVDSGVSDRLRRFAAEQGIENSIKGVEIFASGTWNNDKYTDKDLDTIVNTFQSTKELLKPYLKLGHSENQQLLAEDSLPAAGWISNVYRKGSKLLADFQDIPAKVYELIKKRAYARVSSEIFVNMKVNGKRYPYALKAVALLGGETPAVQTLDDVHALYAVDAQVLAYGKEAEVKTYAFDSAEYVKENNQMPEDKNDAPAEKDNALPGAVPHGAPAAGGAPAPAHPAAPAAPTVLQPQGEPDGDECYKMLKAAHMELDGMKKQMSAMAPKAQQLEGANAAFKLENQNLKKEITEVRDQLGKVSGELEKIYTEQRAKEAKITVEKFVQEKKIVPSQAPALEALLTEVNRLQVKKFKLGDKELDSAEALLKEFVSLGGAGLPTQAVTESGKDIAIPDAQNGQAMDHAVKEYMAKNGEKSYTKAYVAVAQVLSKKEPKKA